MGTFSTSLQPGIASVSIRSAWVKSTTDFKKRLFYFEKKNFFKFMCRSTLQEIRALDLEPGRCEFSPDSASSFPYDLGQATSPLSFSVSLGVWTKWSPWSLPGIHAIRSLSLEMSQAFTPICSLETVNYNHGCNNSQYYIVIFVPGTVLSTLCTWTIESSQQP